jgi:hypothetical protein
MKDHIHLRKAPIQKVPEVPAYVVNVGVGKDPDSHAHVPVFAESSSEYIRMNEKDKPESNLFQRGLTEEGFLVE